MEAWYTISGSNMNMKLPNRRERTFYTLSAEKLCGCSKGEDMQRVVVTEADARDKVRWMQVMNCGDPSQNKTLQTFSFLEGGILCLKFVPTINRTFIRDIFQSAVLSPVWITHFLLSCLVSWLFHCDRSNHVYAHPSLVNFSRFLRFEGFLPMTCNSVNKLSVVFRPKLWVCHSKSIFLSFLE